MTGSDRRGGLLRRAGWALGGKVAAAGGGLGVSVLVTRILDAEQVGVYFILASLAAMGALVSRFGLEKGVLQLVARTPDAIGRGIPRPTVLRAAQVVTIVWVIVAMLTVTVGPAAVGLVTPAALETATFLLLAAWIGALAYGQLLAESFRAADFIAEASAFGGALDRSLAVLALLVVLVTAGSGSITLVLMVVVGTLVVSLLVSTARLCRRWDTDSAPAASWGDAVGLGMPLLISNITLYVAGNADLWILAFYRSDAEVALYGAAVRLVTTVSLFLSIANAILPPMVAKLRSTPVRLERRVRLISTVAAVPSVLVLVVLAGWRAGVLEVLFGEFYRDASGALVVLCIGQLANVLVGSCGYVLVVAGYQRDLMWTAIAAGTVAIGGAVLLAPDFGVVGVAAAVAVGTTIQQLAMLLLARHRTGVWTHVGPQYLGLALRGIRRRWATS